MGVNTDFRLILKLMEPKLRLQYLVVVDADFTFSISGIITLRIRNGGDY